MPRKPLYDEERYPREPDDDDPIIPPPPPPPPPPKDPDEGPPRKRKRKEPDKEPDDDDPIIPPPPPSPPSPIEQARQIVTSGRGRLTTGEDITQAISPFGEGQRVAFYPSADGKRVLELDNFRYGLYTAAKRGSQPVGTFSDVKNFLLNNKRGSLVLRNGYSSYLAAPFSTTSGAIINTFDFLFRSATETPSATDIDLVMGSSGTFIIQKPYFDTTGTNANTWLQWGESIALDLASFVNNTFVVVSASATIDYYKYWYAYNPGRLNGVWVTGYNGGTKTFTTLENVPTNWAAADIIALYRHFHDNTSFVPAYNTDNTIPPSAVTMGDSILASGGRSAAVGNKLCLSTYIDKTLFTGATKTLVTKGTYVTEAEVKSTNGITFGNVVDSAATGKGLDQTAAWALGFLLRTDDNQFTTLLQPSTFYRTPIADKGISSLVTINSNINKRFRYIVPFLAKGETTTQTDFGWDKFFQMPQIDLATAGHGFTYTETSGGVSGFWSKTVAFDITHWNAREAALHDYLDTTKYTSSTVSTSDMLFLNDTLFVSNFYDYVDVRNYTDQVRYSGFSQGSSQPNVLPNIPEFTQTTIEQGDPTSIQKITAYQGKLLILKDNSCYYMDINGTPDTWVLTTISRRVGCDAPNSVETTPFGIVWAKTQDDVYFWNGASPLGMTKNWRSDYRAIIPASAAVKATWRGWYDAGHKTYNLITSTDGTTLKTFHNMFFDLPVGDVFAWSKNLINHDMHRVSIGRDGAVYFVSGQNIYKWNLTHTSDGGTTPINGSAIVPYLKTGQYLITEKDLLAADQWYLVVDQDAAATIAGVLDCKLYLDGISTGSYVAMTKTKNRFQAGVPITAGLFRTIEYEFNSNASPATWISSTSTATPYTIHALGMVVDVREAVGDALVSL